MITVTQTHESDTGVTLAQVSGMPEVYFMKNGGFSTADVLEKYMVKIHVHPSNVVISISDADMGRAKEILKDFQGGRPA